MSEWISVKDRLPTVCDDYLVTDWEFHEIAHFNLSGVWDIYDGGSPVRSERITHWMPLPELPQP